jgi:hypothetical protein
MEIKIIKMKPCRGGWKVFEVFGVEPVFVDPDCRRQAIEYAKTRQGFGRGEIPAINVAGGVVVEVIPFDDTRKEM